MIMKQASVTALTSGEVDAEADPLEAAKSRIDAVLESKGHLDGPAVIEALKAQGFSRAAGSRAIAFYVSRGEYRLGFDNVLSKSGLA